MTELSKPRSSHWHHAPRHEYCPGVAYLITGATLHKQHFFDNNQKLKHLEETLFEIAEASQWTLEEWAIFSNHYHLIGVGAESTWPLAPFIQKFHSETAIWLNELEGSPGRQVWYQFWETALTYKASYYARLNYVHHNPAHHGLVALAANYPFCSARHMVVEGANVRQRQMLTYKWNRIKVEDDYEPVYG